MQIERTENLVAYRLTRLIEQDLDGFKAYCKRFNAKTSAQPILLTVDGIDYSITPQGVRTGSGLLLAFPRQIQATVADILSNR